MTLLNLFDPQDGFESDFELLVAKPRPWPRYPLLQCVTRPPDPHLQQPFQPFALPGSLPGADVFRPRPV